MTSNHDAPTPTAGAVWDVVLDMQAKLHWLATVDLGCVPDDDMDALVVEMEEAARTLPAV